MRLREEVRGYRLVFVSLSVEHKRRNAATGGSRNFTATTGGATLGSCSAGLWLLVASLAFRSIRQDVAITNGLIISTRQGSVVIRLNSTSMAQVEPRALIATLSRLQCLVLDASFDSAAWSHIRPFSRVSLPAEHGNF